MDVIIDKLVDLGFSRTPLPLSNILVVNCVPGAGKTSFIRELVQSDYNFEAFTTGVPDNPNLTGNHITKWAGIANPEKFTILDEYQRLTSFPEGVQAVFGDPTQSCSPYILAPHLICWRTHRFGSETCALLNSIGFPVNSVKIDSVRIRDIYSEELVGQTICCEPEVEKLLSAHGVPFLNHTEVIGQTYDKVTFVTSNQISRANRQNHLICLTRHSLELLILCPDGLYV
uniref:Triple gene block protein 1 n=1 Tax=Papaya mild mottle associated virus TaxID=2716617 RepID=A0A6G7S6S4_9VIRU|nr:Triple gene block protein 1 [Papaya mild mottle associated virus]